VTCVYELEALCSCPVDGKSDYYAVTVTSAAAIPVETILAAVKGHGAQRQFQEAFSEALSRTLGAKVRTVGRHSGVKVTITCGAEE
jgi:hypothetical protein